MRNFRIILAFHILVLCYVVTAFGQETNGQTGAKTAKSPATVVDPQPRVEEGYRIGYQDVIDIQVFHHADLTQRVAVSPAGTIVLFRLDHPVSALCKTERELADDITAAYKEKYLKDPQVTVLVAEQKSQAVAVMGAVDKPGRFYIPHRVHLLELLALAGGPNKESGAHLLVARTGSTTNCKAAYAPDDDSIAIMDFKIRDVEEGKQTLWMKPGDVVSVLAADIVYVYGNVNKQGALKIRDTITLTQAIASAEGLKAAARKDKVRVLRQAPGKMDRDEFVYDLNQIDKGKVRDPILEPNDIVAVSEDKTKSILLGVGSALKSSVPSAVYRLPGL